MNRIKKNKKSSGKILCDNGISFKSDISFSIEKPKPYLFMLVRLAIAVIAAVAVVYMLPGFLRWKNFSSPVGTKFNFRITNPTAVFTAIFLTALSTLLSNMKQAFFKAAGIVYMLFNAVFIIVNLKSAVSGFMYMANAYTRGMGFSAPVFSSRAAQATQSDIEMFLVAFSFLITILISFGCIYHINFPVMFLATFPIFELGAFHGWNPYPWTVAAMIVTWIVTLSLNLINHTTRKRGSGNTFAVYAKKKAFYLTSENVKSNFFGTASSFVIVLTTLCFVASALFAGLSGNYRPKSFAALRRTISNGFRDYAEEISSKTSFGSNSVPGRSKSLGGTNGGRLGVYDKIEFTGKTALRVSTEEFDYSLYLRGYVAESYSDNCWSPIDVDDDVMSVFESMGQTVLDYNYLQCINSAADFSQISKLTIKTVNAASDVLYAPYGTNYSVCDNADEQKYEGMISTKDGDEEYTVVKAVPDLTSWDDIISYANQNSKKGGYYDLYSAYSDEVYSNAEYTYVPEDILPVIDEILQSEEISYTDSIVTIKRKIKNYFSKQGFYYTTEPGVTPTGEDFIKYFLTEQKKGYCTYYASAGVMLMRRLGVPARYVEGYVISPSQYSADKSSIAVSDRCAHAWCEIFIEGYGWFPLEFTPGYDNTNPNLTDTEKNISSTSDSSSLSESKAEVKITTEVSKSDSSEKSASSASTQAKDSNFRAENSIAEFDSDSDTAVVGLSDENDASGGTVKVNLSKQQVAYVLFTVCLVTIFVLSLAVRRKSKLEKLNQRVNNTDCTKAVIDCYVAFLRYISLLGITADDNATDVQLAYVLSDKLNEIEPSLSSEFITLSNSAIAAYMSGCAAQESESVQARNALKNASEAVYSRLNAFRKFTAKWIYGLY